EHKDKSCKRGQDNIYEPYPEGRGENVRRIGSGYHKAEEIGRGSSSYPKIVQHCHRRNNGLHHQDHADKHHRSKIVKRRKKKMDKQEMLQGKSQVPQETESKAYGQLLPGIDEQHAEE